MSWLTPTMKPRWRRAFADAAQFKFGVSYQFRQPVSTLLMERMPATLELAICATVFAMVSGILMGVYSALRRDQSARGVTTGFEPSGGTG